MGRGGGEQASRPSRLLIPSGSGKLGRTIAVRACEKRRGRVGATRSALASRWGGTAGYRAAS